MKKPYSFKILFGIVSLLALSILIDGCKHDPDLSGTPLPPDPPAPDICDTLNITFNGTNLEITDAGGTKTIDLSSLQNTKALLNSIN